MSWPKKNGRQYVCAKNRLSMVMWMLIVLVERMVGEAAAAAAERERERFMEIINNGDYSDRIAILQTAACPHRLTLLIYSS